MHKMRNISKSEDNQELKEGKTIGKSGNIFLEKSYIKRGGEQSQIIF